MTDQQQNADTGRCEECDGPVDADGWHQSEFADCSSSKTALNAESGRLRIVAMELAAALYGAVEVHPALMRIAHIANTVALWEDEGINLVYGARNDGSEER